MKKIMFIATSLATIMLTFYFFMRHYKKAPPLPFLTTSPEYTTIKKKILCAGSLHLKNLLRLGSLVAGTVEEIYVHENDHVKKNTPIARINLGKSNHDFKYAYHLYRKAQHEYHYQNNAYARQKALFEKKQLAQDTFERFERDLKTSYECMKSAKALMKKYQEEINNALIKSPVDGIVVALHISKGSAVINDFQNILCEIAENTNEIEARLDIDESDIVHLKKGLTASIVLNAYPQKKFKGAIESISIIPGNDTSKDPLGQRFYKAIVPLSPNEGTLLLPGLLAHAKINIEHKKNILSLPIEAFHLNQHKLTMLAHRHNISIKPYPDKIKNSSTRYVWKVQTHSLIEQEVTIGISDECRAEILSGINEHDTIVIQLRDED